MTTGGRDLSPAPRPGGEMTLLEHLEELRSVLLQAGAAILAAMAVCWFFSARLLDLLVRPLEGAGQHVYFHQPAEAFVMRLRLALAAGLLLVAPFVLFRFYRFVLPGLYRQERRVVGAVLWGSVLLFYAGVGFAYLVMIPKVVVFMLGFGTEFMQPLIGAGAYFSFVVRLCLAFGLMFELPLVVLAFAVMGLVTPEQLWRGWRYALLVILAAAAILTPPDVFSQLVMAGPVMLLYLLSAGVAQLVVRRRRLPRDHH